MNYNQPLRFTKNYTNSYRGFFNSAAFITFKCIWKMIETKIPVERAILIGIIYPGQDESEVDDFLEELSFLTETAGAEPVKRFIQKLDVPNPRTFVGSGKIQEIALFVGENKIDIAIFDDELPKPDKKY